MKINNFKQCFYLAITTSLFITGVVSANVGQVSAARGDVKAQREQLVQLHRFSILQEKDIIITGADGRAQLLMIDKAKIIIKSSSEFSLDEYRLAQQSSANSNLVGTNKSSVTMSLLKGGFRTISGAIGSGVDKSEYLVKTPIATIGIRGTDYSALLCDATCASPEQSENMAPGLYVGVSSGSILISNAMGELLLTAGQYAYVASINDKPVRIVTPPLFLMSDATNPLVINNYINNSRTLGDSGGIEIAEATTTESTPAESTTADPTTADPTTADPTTADPTTADPITADPTTVDPIFAYIPIGDVPIGDILLDDLLLDDNLILRIIGSDDIIVTTDGIDSVGNIVQINNVAYDFSNIYSIGFSGLFGTNSDYSVVSGTPADSVTTSGIGLLEFYSLSPTTGIGTLFSIGQAQQINVGYDALSGLSWGRWGGNFMTSTSSDGSVTEIDLSNSSMHWLVNNFQDGQALPISGSANFQLIGNTDPTNNSGDVGILGSASFFVDFTNQTVSNSLSLGIAGSVWSASGSGTIVSGTSWFEGVYSSVVIDGIANGTGDFSGIFSSLMDANGIPFGAGLNYVLRDGAEEIINGVLIFGYRP